MNKPKMTVIGFGRMGSKYAEFFTDGFDVWVSSSRDVEDEAHGIGASCVDDLGEAISTSEYIFIAVPIHALDAVVAQINERVKPSAWAFDMCSARVVAARKMAALKCKWFGWHGALLGDAPESITSYLEARGYSPQSMTPEEHDRRNSVIALAHFIGMAAESVLTDSDFEIMKSSPAATNLLKLIQHLRNNAPDTYWESQICNPFTRDQRQRIVTGFAEYASELDANRFPFCERLEKTKY